ncbi:N-terminal cleavage protein [Opitutaceae bacterium TAV5]|nr:N-terminal cleavage protein [Opitutaceae bacterium TAV5]
MKTTRQTRNASAFTLVELLVVIVIIGILAGIILPVVSSVRRTSRTALCVSNLRQIATAGQLWITENRGHLPDAYLWQVGGDNRYSLRSYLGISTNSSAKQTGVFTCPESFLRHPSPLTGLSDNLRTYGIVMSVCRTYDGDIDHGDVKGNAKTIEMLRSPGKTAFFTDGDLLSATGNARRFVYSGVFNPGNIWTGQKPLGLLAVHKGKVNVAFIDTHVETRDPATIPSNTSEGSIEKAQAHVFWGERRRY